MFKYPFSVKIQIYQKNWSILSKIFPFRQFINYGKENITNYSLRIDFMNRWSYPTLMRNSDYREDAPHFIKLKSKKAYFFNCERHLSGLFYNYLENFILIEFMWRVDQVKRRWYPAFEFSFIYDITFDPTYKSFFRKRLSHSILQAALWRIWCCYQAYWGFMGRIFV